MKKVNLESLQVVEQSAETAIGFICGGGCLGYLCLRDDGTFHWGV